MNAFFEKIRIAREKRGLSLDDIAAATRIQQTILKDIEDGDTAKLPAAYVRAFLRSYAKEVGLDESRVLRDYDAISEPPVAAPPAPSQDQPRGGALLLAAAKRFSENHVPLIAAGVLTVSLVIALLVVGGTDGAEPAREIPFSEVVKQRDPIATNETTDTAWAQRTPGALAAGNPPPETPPQRVAPQPLAPPPLLVLRAMTFDSVWIRILIDGKVREEHAVPPRWSGQWRASDNFVISLSNAAAVALTLNNRSLGIIGTPGTPVQNFVIRRSDLEPR